MKFITLMAATAVVISGCATAGTTTDVQRSNVPATDAAAWVYGISFIQPGDTSRTYVTTDRHVNGHTFAANVVIVPHGTFDIYSPEATEEWVSATYAMDAHAITRTQRSCSSSNLDPDLLNEGGTVHGPRCASDDNLLFPGVRNQTTNDHNGNTHVSRTGIW